MKSLLFGLLLGCSALTGLSQEKEPKAPAPDKNKEILMVEAACGECKLGLPGKTCDLAIRIKGQSYFVDGTKIDSHGDAHAKDGFCNAIRKAKVQGELVNNRFVATYFELVPDAPKKEKSN